MNAEEGPLKTDDLLHLKEGEVFVDSESGKKYRVRKSAYSQQSISGPYGVGDPNDRSLRRLEADVLIPNRMDERVRKVECRETLAELTRCLKKEGEVVGLRKCQPELARYDECRLANYQKYLPECFMESLILVPLFRFNDPWFRQKITDEYVKERAEFRRTGRTAVERKWDEYCDYKRKKGDWASIGENANA
ncbi:unnamed protein product [Gongylonema pulchrum]|uniref:COX assembly mitochondrial protein n=1 Tax=Gongylonema pulchrum TaxID=637853 RepID=A0A183E4M5_9BILA|nr:unnamed protein product [Gongylonema pulchrum]